MYLPAPHRRRNIESARSTFSARFSAHTAATHTIHFTWSAEASGALPSLRVFACGLTIAQRRRLCDSVVFVFNGKNGPAPQPHHALGVVFRGKPEVIHFAIPVVTLRFLDPERRVLGRLSFDSPHGKEPFFLDQEDGG